MALIIKDNNVAELKARLEELLQQKDIEFSRMKPSKLPEKAGVYVISDSCDMPLYIGRTKNLKQRLYYNHLMGHLSNACLKKYLIDARVVKDKEEAKEFIFQNCKVRWIFEEDYRMRGFLEGYFTGIFAPDFGIDLEH